MQIEGDWTQMTTFALPKKSDGSSRTRVEELAQWSAKVLLGVQVLRRMAAESRRTVPWRAASLSQNARTHALSPH
jgi:hypothetical protein